MDIGSYNREIVVKVCELACDAYSEGESEEGMGGGDRQGEKRKKRESEAQREKGAYRILAREFSQCHIIHCIN